MKDSDSELGSVSFLGHLCHRGWFVSDWLEELHHFLRGVELNLLGFEHSHVELVQTPQTGRPSLVHHLLLLPLLSAGVLHHHLVEIVNLRCDPLEISDILTVNNSNIIHWRYITFRNINWVNSQCLYKEKLKLSVQTILST